MPINEKGRAALKALFELESGTVEGFTSGLTSVERSIYNALIGELTALSASEGGIALTKGNQARLTLLKQRILKDIKNSKYPASVAGYVRSFDALEKLTINKYQAISNLTPQLKWFEALNTESKKNITELLTGSGFEANVLNPILKDFRTMVVTGADVLDISNMIRLNTIGDGDVLGKLSRYAGQIAKDGINQYSGAIDEVVGTKFDLNWGIYTGAIIKTSRPQCRDWVDKEYIHRSEIDGLIGSAGAGMIPGTNESNFAINRGGYNCEHSFTWVSDEIVPEDLRLEFVNNN